MTKSRLAKALEAERPLDEFRAIVRDMIAHGSSREAVVEELERFRASLRESGRDHDEDVVLEVMDFVEGWCSPHMKI